MTELEIILVALLWIAYGVLCLYQMNNNEFEDAEPFFWVLYISLAPLWLIVRAIMGIFSNKLFD